MKKFFYWFCAGALLLAGGCSDDEESESEQERKIAFADIVDAQSLYLTGTGGTRASDEELQPSALFKVTFDGATETVIFTDENGKPVDVKVQSFRRLSDSYIYMCLEIPISYHYSQWKHLIIRRSDGAVFEMDPLAFGNYNDWSPIIDTETTVQTDYNENVYFKNDYPYIIYKIYTHGNEVYATQINRDDMHVVDGWLVDRRGNVLINEDYIRLVSGEFARYSGKAYFYAWNDSEGFYDLDCDRVDSEKKGDQGKYSYSYKIKYCRPTSPTSTFETIKNVFEAKSYSEWGAGFYFMPLVYKDKTVLFQDGESKYHKGKRYRIDIYNKDRIELQEMEYHPLPEGISFDYYGQKYPHTERYLYGMSESEIWRLDVETGVPEMLYKYDDEFVIKSMTVRNDIVTFTAFELRRGNDVVAEIYPDKTVKVLESINGDKIIYFERLN